ncbi:MAG: futalosine hydrolase [Planctomycetes bacterium]|nr:futalosine hydrolase [Planctomycetota bacterium]MCB9906041.1 futalosine hydrolase [Planctomycetota bacterium]
MKDAPLLLLVPTALELERLRDQGGYDPARARVEVCGFGPVAAAARTATLLERYKPQRALLVGIAGTFDEESFPVGTATTFGEVALEGVGVGEGSRFVAPPALGFPQWPGSTDTTPHPIADRMRLEASGPLLLSTCAASDSPAHAAERKERFPAALAEDMEGFAVALACALARVPLSIVRGASNVVGDRQASAWRIPSALAAAHELSLEWLAKEPA